MRHRKSQLGLFMPVDEISKLKINEISLLLRLEVMKLNLKKTRVLRQRIPLPWHILTFFVFGY